MELLILWKRRSKKASWEVSFSPKDAEELLGVVGDGGRSGQARSIVYARS